MFAVSGGECMVPMELDGFNVCSFSGCNAWAVFDEVATHCDSGSFGIFLFRADGANDSRVGNCSAFGYLVFVCMKKIVLVPFTLFPTPWARLPSSLAQDRSQSSR